MASLRSAKISGLTEDQQIVLGAFRMAAGYSSSYTIPEIVEIFSGYSPAEMSAVVAKMQEMIRMQPHDKLKKMNNLTFQKISKFLSKNYDELAVLFVLGHMAGEEMAEDYELTQLDKDVLEAIGRSSEQFKGKSPEQIGEIIKDYDDEQIDGLVNNVKGIATELKYVRAENTDGDHIKAEVFEETNHPDTDVKLTNTATGEVEEVQLKATDDPGYIKDWQESHEGQRIVVTEEMADKLHLESAGVSNQEITADTREVIDKMIESADDEKFWDHFPVLGAFSVGAVIFLLWQRHKSGEISFEQFKKMSAKAAGIKVAKMGLIAVALSIPGLNFFAGVYLTAKLVFGITGALK